ncbi:YqiA/YcfP family alpha/beta fold hydrolase [Microbulbifer variabilis]|uniref:YqiA/YcfP family alpha/beta fold hydrolase n=1 Tax=Microbulbifer variabilis TaxID=266805 RepID=UPI001CFD6C33|nr:YqiA/YcfP family alpha/beta fold hydrolase [Microbulbifer variabilis]
MQTQNLNGRPLLIYLHGFLSSPQSFKCQLMRERLAADHPQIIFCAPQISPYPGNAQQSLLRLLDSFLDSGNTGPIGLVGSSMGGFWCTYLGERYRLPAVLINPAVRPSRFMPSYVGKVLQPYSGEPQEYRLSGADVDTMAQLEAELPSPLLSRYWLLAQRGDETLDYRDAESFYQGQRQTVEEGGDHSFQGFARYCDPIVEFLFNQQ